MLSQAVTLVLGILIPKLMIVSYGSEVNGLMSSVRQIFVCFSLLEAGIGRAALQAMYQPIAAGDRRHASEIMAAVDHYYRRTGVLYGVAVALLSVVYPFAVHTDIPPAIIIPVILFQGASGVINYFFQGKYQMLLRVDGRGYVTTNASTVVSIMTKAAQIVLILSGISVVAVQVAHFAIHLLQMLIITWYVKKHYSWLDLKATPDYRALSQSKNVVIHQVSGLVFNNTDVLLLTFFCGLKPVSIYALYSLIVSCVSDFIDTICMSVEFALGQAFHSDRKRYMKLQEIYETYYLDISFSLFTIALIMLPSFVRLYSSGITDANYVDRYLPYLFVALNVLMYARRSSAQIINFAGHFRQTQGRTILESAINLTVSIVLVRWIGIYGVLIGTIVALLYRTNDMIIYANCKILERKPWKTYRRWGQNLAVMAACVFLLKQIIPGQIDSYWQWALYAAAVSAVCLPVFFAVDSLFDRESCQFAKGMIGGYIRQAFHRGML